MKRFYVFHNPNFLDKIITGGISLELVAAVDGNDIEDAFHLTNNIDKPWFENDNIIATYQGAYTGKGCRSTSVYDLVVDEDVVYICDSFGWKRHDHLTKWWNMIVKKRMLAKVKEMENYLEWLNEPINLPELEVTEEDFEAGRYDSGNEPLVFTFDKNETPLDDDFPF